MPRLYSDVKMLYKRGKFRFHHQRIQHLADLYSKFKFHYITKSNSFSLFMINPRDVHSIQAGPPNRDGFDERGRLPEKKMRILDGDWYTWTMPIAETYLYKGFVQHFIERKEWQETVLNPRVYRQLHPTLPRKYMNYDMAGFLKRGKVLDSLYTALENHYKDYEERGDYFWNEIGINIGPHEEFIHNSCGFHRLLLSQLIGIKQVPVRILTVHSDAVKAYDEKIRKLNKN